jgi:hypothetical protein
MRGHAGLIQANSKSSTQFTHVYRERRRAGRRREIRGRVGLKPCDPGPLLEAAAGVDAFWCMAPRQRGICLYPSISVECNVN